MQNMDMDTDIDIMNTNTNMNNNISRNSKRKYMNMNTNTLENELNIYNAIEKYKLNHDELSYDSIKRKSKLRNSNINYDTVLQNPILAKNTNILGYQDYIALFQDLQKCKINIYNKALHPTYNKNSFSIHLLSLYPVDINEWCSLLIEQHWTYESLISHMNMFDKNVFTYLSPVSDCENKIPDNTISKNTDKYYDTKSVLDLLYEFSNTIYS